jgi:hypothetical protein
MRKHLLAVILLVALMTQACGVSKSTISENTAFPGNTAVVPTTSTPTATSTAASSPTATVPLFTSTPAAEPEQTAALPPLAYEELLVAGVESGLWTEGEGLVLFLQYFVGGEPAGDIPQISEVADALGTGVIHMAWDYLNQADSDPAQMQEIVRLMRILSPPQEVLDATSKQVSLNTGAKMAAISRRPSTQNQTACTDFAGTGYEGRFDPGVNCYHYVENELDGNIIRVYFPEWWQGDSAKENQVGLTLDALAKAALTYSQFSALTIKDIHVVFAILSNEDIAGLKGPFNTATQACPITMYPLAFEEYNAEQYRQMLAHEVFHCVQAWSFPGGTPHSAHKWWMEGSAEYFSNLVEPAANFEWRALEWFDYRSTYTSIFDLAYTNFAFFQFMGNQYSPDVLIDILKRVSAAGSRSSQEAALAGVQGMDVNFNRFVVEYLSTGILDSGGGRIFLSQNNLSGTKTIENEGELRFDVKPFVAMRYTVNYKEQKRYLQNVANNEDTQFSSVEFQQRRNIELWSDLPPEIRSECEKDVPYLFVMTTVKDHYTSYDLNVTKAEKAECDPCLLGTWDVDRIKYAALMEKIINQGGADIDLLVTGHLYLQFETNGKASTRRVDLTIIPNGIVSTTLNGSGDGNYTADGKQMTISNLVDNTTSAAINWFGFPGPDISTDSDLNEGNVAQTETAAYVCQQDSLTISLPEYGEMVFNRVDEILPTPVPTSASPSQP